MSSDDPDQDAEIRDRVTQLEEHEKAVADRERERADQRAQRRAWAVSPEPGHLVTSKDASSRMKAVDTQRPSPRQLEILALVANGLTREEVARALFLSPLTVRNKSLEARDRVEASNVTHAIVLCVARGYLGVDGRDESVYVPTPIEAEAELVAA